MSDDQDGAPGVRRWRDIKAARGEPRLLHIEQIVAIQQAACEGRSAEEIAADMGLALDAVRRVTDDGPLRREPQVERPVRARVDFAKAKRR